MTESVQISAAVSEETRALLERYTRASGMKKGRVIEAALRQYLQVLHELPPEAIIPARLVLSKKAGRDLLERIQDPAAPTDAMRALFDS